VTLCLCSRNSCPCHWPRPKAVIDTIRKGNPSQPMRWGNMHSRRLVFSFWGEKGMGFFSQFRVPKCVPHGFSMFPPSAHRQCISFSICSQVPNSSTLYPLFFPKSSFVNIWVAEKRRIHMSTLGVAKVCSSHSSLGHVDKYYFTKYLVCQHWVLFFWVMDKSKRSITKRKWKPLLSHLPQLINTIITLT